MQNCTLVKQEVVIPGLFNNIMAVTTLQRGSFAMHCCALGAVSHLSSQLVTQPLPPVRVSKSQPTHGVSVLAAS